MYTILINHTGYTQGMTKKIVVQSDGSLSARTFDIIDCKGSVVTSGELIPVGTVRHWNKGEYFVGRFDDLDDVGTYRAKVGDVTSEPFAISDFQMNLRLASAATSFFKGQRCSGWWDHEDSQLHFAGERKGVIDVHGGWFDASGDHGIHLSHLSHSTWYNPQQIGFNVYAFYKAYDQMKEKGIRSYDLLLIRMLDEGVFGADFLMRMHAPSGSFFRSIRRHEDIEHIEKIRGTRTLGFEYHGSSDQFSRKASTADEETVDDTNYETSLRSGGALAIAALAIAGRHETSSLEYRSEDYLECAKKAWAYLKENNERYANDGKWNFVDYHTSLIATTELYKSTKDEQCLEDCRMLVSKIHELSEDLGDNCARLLFRPGMPYHHAAEEGMPVIGLVEYSLVEPDKSLASAAYCLAESVIRHTVKLTDGEANPFGYPIFECLEEGRIISRFFFPHHTTVSPWWQGENARLSSIAAAARLIARHTDDKVLCDRLGRLADDCLDWIFGQNPYDSCMMEGYGRNNPQYYFEGRYEYLNTPGGIVNGITSSEADEDSIDFVYEQRADTRDNWRWAEQWLPHVSWFLYAKSLERL